MGVPVVATAIRGCRQVVDDGVTGRLVRPRDAGLLAATVAGLAADPFQRRQMGAAAHRRALVEFDQQHQIDITLALYAELLDRG